MKQIAFGLFVFGLFALSADAASWQLKATAAGGAADKGLNNNTWVSIEDPTVESTTVNPDDDYYVFASPSLYSGHSDQIVFGGNSLTLGDAEKKISAAFLHYYSIGVHGNKDLTLSGDGLFLEYGRWETEYGSANSPYRVYSKITVRAPEENPFRIFRNNVNETTLEIHGAFCGSGWVSVDAGTAPRYTLALLDSYDAFSGGIRLDSSGSDATLKIGRLLVTSGTSSGTVKAATACRVVFTLS